VIQTIQLGVPIARCELLDAVTIKAVNAHSKLGLKEAPMLFCEFHGSPASVAEQAETVQAIAREQGGMDFEWATKQEDRTRLWQARHDAYPACLRLKPGGRAMSTDVCVPISRLAECIAETDSDVRESHLNIALFGHVGDGNFHLAIVVDPNDPRDLEEAERINHRVVSRALAMNGTCTGEHGIGYGKLDFLDAEHGDAVSVMRSIKQALDPRNLFNRGKVIRDLTL
jgi:D-lactate dehydrogenase (cytochrome)